MSRALSHFVLFAACVLSLRLQAEPPVTAEELAQSHHTIRSQVHDPDHGAFGPGSMTWKIFGEKAVVLSLGPSTLMMLAHPSVSTIIENFSQAIQTRPNQRLGETAKLIADMIYGDLEAAFSAARRIHAVHSHLPEITAPDGTIYSARDPQAQLWVVSVFWLNAMRVYEQTVGKLTPQEKEAFMREAKTFAQLMGIPVAIVPRDLRAFEDYLQSKLSSFHPTPFVRELVGKLADTKHLGKSGNSKLGQLPGARTMVDAYVRYSAGFLPLPLATELRLGQRSRLIDGVLSAIRLIQHVTPSFLRQRPSFRAATARTTRTVSAPPEDSRGCDFAKLAGYFAPEALGVIQGR